MIDIRTPFEQATDAINNVCFEIWLRDCRGIELSELDAKHLKLWLIDWHKAKLESAVAAVGEATDA